MVTIKDVAQKAGVTAAAVSMALNGKPSISSETRRKIIRIAKEMGYVPSAAAKALRTNRSNALGLIVGNLENDFFLDIIHAVEEYASGKGYIIFICDAEHSSSKVITSLRALAARGVDGILISLGFYPDGELENEIRRVLDDGIKMLSFSSAVSYEGVPTVRQDELEALFRMTDRIYELGHRNVGIISCQPDSWLHITRVKSMLRALEARGIGREELVVYGDMSTESGMACAMQLLSSHPEITCLMCVNDIVAFGAMKGAGLLGRSIPSDLSITGFDGVAFSKLISPELSTLHVPRYEMGLVGCRNIIGWIEDESTAFPHEIMISSTFVEGETLSGCRKEAENEDNNRM